MGRLIARSKHCLLALCLAALLAGGAAITTTDALVESTHTPLPATPPAADLSEAETQDPGARLEIVKQIRRVNQDGSYTVGYEAEDGTFKIESRDVLGNIKGTYGYIDAQGDIKRVSYGGAGQPARATTTTAAAPTTEEEVVHIPPRFNRSQPHHQPLLVPTTRRPPNYQPPATQQLQQLQLHHSNPPHASTLRPSVIQTIPRKRPGYPPTSTTAAAAASSVSMPAATATSALTTLAAATPTTPMSAAPSGRSTLEGATTPRPTAETGGQLAAAFGEPTAASSHGSRQSTLLVIRPTPLPYQAAKTAEQLARPDRLDAPGGKYGAPVAPSKKPVRGNFLRRQLPSPAASAAAAAAAAAAAESGEQFEAQQQQQIVYGQSVAEGDLGSLFSTPGKPLYTAHPTPRIPAAVLAARQRAAALQSVLAVQAGKERVYAKQPVRPALYEPTQPPGDHDGSYVTDGPGSASVVQIPAANRATTVAATEADPDSVDERRPLFRPRPVEFRVREAAPAGRYRTPYGLPPPFARAFPPQEHPAVYGGRAAESNLEDGEREPDDPQQHLQQQQHQQQQQPPPAHYQHQQLSSAAPYRQQRRLSGGGFQLPAADSGYGGPQQQQQQQQNTFPIPAPYSPAHYPGGGRANPAYYYDIPAERPLTARDFERILQLLIFRHQQLQQVNQRYRGGGGGGGGYYGGYHGGGGGGGFPGYNPYFPGPSPSPFGPYLGGGGGYPQQQIPRPPLPYPYGSPYDAGVAGYQNPLYSPSAPSASMRAGPDPDADGGYGQAARRHGQQYFPADGSGAGSAVGPSGGSHRGAASDYLPPDVRESLLYRMLMLAIQTSGGGGGGSNEVLPLPLAHHQQGLQGASSMPRPHTHQRVHGGPQQDGTVAASPSASTPLPMFSKKPVRSVQILGEE